MPRVKAYSPQLAGLTADVWVSERHNRQLEVTTNPIEMGAPAPDHAFLKQRVLSVSFGVTNSPLFENNSFTDDDRVTQAREALYLLQTNVVFIEVITVMGGKYENCLISDISFSADKDNVNAVVFDIQLTEVEIKTTELTEYQALPAEKPIKKKTEPTKKRGEVPKKRLEKASKGKGGRKNTRDVSKSSKEQSRARLAAEQKKALKK